MHNPLAEQLQKSLAENLHLSVKLKAAWKKHLNW